MDGEVAGRRERGPGPGDAPGSDAGAVAALADLVRGAGSVVALTGAGISVPSGIPDFRTPGAGIWENVDPMEVAHIDAWRADPERFWTFYDARAAVRLVGDVEAELSAVVAALT